MKVFVIDNTEQLAEFSLTTGADVVYFADEIQALNAAEQLQPAFIFLNYAVLGQQTPDYIRLLLDVTKAAKLVVIGNSTCEDEVLRCLVTGANGYQDKQQLPQYLSKLIRVVAQGEAWVSRKMVTRVLDTLRQLNMQTMTA